MCIDLVIPWVDSEDQIWKKEKSRYSGFTDQMASIDDSESRYRDWDTVKYLFRSIEMYMPWVGRIFFITYGHLPSWMNLNNDRIRIVNHKDFIPIQYLPTFCSHTIELNIHRISDLSEQFIYFNDDILVLKPLKEDDFFLGGLPRDYAILNPINCATRYSVQDIALTDMEIVNDHFVKNEQVKKNIWKWFSLSYGGNLLRSLCLMPWPHFVGFLGKHQGNAYLKATFEEVWEKEYEILDSTCKHRFRTRRDVNQWLMRYWQLASGKFIPIAPYGEMFTIGNNNQKLIDVIEKSTEKTICINDSNIEIIKNFEVTKKELISILESRFPHKSQFEK